MITILILAVLVVIAIKLCVKPRAKFDASDYHTGAWNRLALGIFAAAAGVGYPPLFLLAGAFFASAFFFFRRSSAK